MFCPRFFAFLVLAGVEMAAMHIDNHEACFRQPMVSSFWRSSNGNTSNWAWGSLLGAVVPVQPTRHGCRILSLARSRDLWVDDKSIKSHFFNREALIVTPFSRRCNLFHHIYDDLFASWFTLDAKQLRSSDVSVVLAAYGPSEFELSSFKYVFPDAEERVSRDTNSSPSVTYFESATVGVDQRYDFLQRMICVGDCAGPAQELQFPLSAQLLAFAEFLRPIVKRIPQGNQLVFFSRPVSATRRVLNEQECESVLRDWAQSNGLFFQSLSFNTTTPLSSQIAAVSHTRIVVGVHGAALALLLFAAHRAFIDELISID